MAIAVLLILCVLAIGLPQVSAQRFYESLPAYQVKYIISPRYPSNFVMGHNISWTLEAPPGYKIALKCELFEIPNCSNYFGVNSYGYTYPTSYDYKYCGTSPFTHLSRENWITVNFKSVTNIGRFYCSVVTQFDPCSCGRHQVCSIATVRTMIFYFPPTYTP